MLADSPDTTALFFNTSFQPELSQPEATVPSGFRPDVQDDPTRIQSAWATEWILNPIAIEGVDAKVLDIICKDDDISNPCTRQTLSPCSSDIVSKLLADEQYNLEIIYQLINLNGFKIVGDGHEFIALIDLLMHQLLGDVDDLQLVLKCLQGLSKNQELKTMIKKHAKINKLYKKLTNMLKHDDDDIVLYSLFLLIRFLADTSLGKKLFNESSIMEAFTLLFSSPSLCDESAQKNPIFQDLLGLMLDNKEYLVIFEKFVSENWTNDLEWCNNKSLDSLIAITEFMKRGLLEDAIQKNIQKFDFYSVAINYLLVEYSNDALDFVKLILERSTREEYVIKYLKLSLEISKKFSSGDPFLKLYLHINNESLPKRQDYDYQSVAEKFYPDEVNKIRTFPPCFAFLENDLHTLEEIHEECERIQTKLFSNSKDTVLSALTCIQRMKDCNLDSLADFLMKSKRKHNNLEDTIANLETQLLQAIEDSKKFVTIKEELMNAKLQIVKEKLDASEVEHKKSRDRSIAENEQLKVENTKMKDQLTELSKRFQEATKSMEQKDDMIQNLSFQNDEKEQTINNLNDKILELEDSIGEQEEAHQEMVAKLAQSLDSLANRKTKFSKKKASNTRQEGLESLEKSLESTRI